MKMTISKHNFLPFYFPFQVVMRGGEGRAAVCGLTFLLSTRIARKQQSREVRKVRSRPCLSFPVLADWKRETNGQRIDIFVTKLSLPPRQ